MKEVNARLYDFLKENETGLFKDKNNHVIAYVHIYFCDLNDFVDIVGYLTFDDGGLDVKMFDNTICIDLNDIIEDDGHKLSSYSSCFSDWDEYKNLVLEYEKD